MWEIECVSPAVLRPTLFEKRTKVRGPQRTPTKEAVSLRLDRDVLDHFRAKGEGWQTKINEVLRRSAEAEAGTTSKGVGNEEAENGVKACLGRFEKFTALVSKAIKSLSASALTQRSGISPATRRDKKRSK